MRERDTIYATSSGAPPAAIAIVRVSGPSAFAVAIAISGRLPAPRYMTLRALRTVSGTLIDRALVVVFPAPRTATGEDLVEFHVHGGRAVVDAVHAAIAACPGTRRAEAGEFTRRALENGVIDFTAAEGLGDLLAAQTETQRRAALRMTEGGVRALIEGWTDRLVEVAAQVEAELDFSDEDDVTGTGSGAGADVSAVASGISRIAVEIATVLASPPVERLYDGLRVVIAGPPNSGKSTLLNALVGREVAIVSAISGTTRDRIEAPVIRDGIAYLLMDTAGLTDAPGDEIERIGIARARDAMAGADIVLWVGDTAPVDTSWLAIHTRADLPDRTVMPAHCDLAISARTGAGMAALWSAIAKRAASLLPQEDSIVVNRRQRELLIECNRSLHGALVTPDPLVIAEELRTARSALDRVTGRADVEAVLDAVFSRFCIGK